MLSTIAHFWRDLQILYLEDSTHLTTSPAKSYSLVMVTFEELFVNDVDDDVPMAAAAAGEEDPEDVEEVLLLVVAGLLVG